MNTSRSNTRILIRSVADTPSFIEFILSKNSKNKKLYDKGTENKIVVSVGKGYGYLWIRPSVFTDCDFEFEIIHLLHDITILYGVNNQALLRSSNSAQEFRELTPGKTYALNFHIKGDQVDMNGAEGFGIMVNKYRISDLTCYFERAFLKYLDGYINYAKNKNDEKQIILYSSLREYIATGKANRQLNFSIMGFVNENYDIFDKYLGQGWIIHEEQQIEERVSPHRVFLDSKVSINDHIDKMLAGFGDTIMDEIKFSIEVVNDESNISFESIQNNASIEVLCFRYLYFLSTITVFLSSVHQNLLRKYPDAEERLEHNKLKATKMYNITMKVKQNRITLIDMGNKSIFSNIFQVYWIVASVYVAMLKHFIYLQNTYSNRRPDLAIMYKSLSSFIESAILRDNTEMFTNPLPLYRAFFYEYGRHVISK